MILRTLENMAAIKWMPSSGVEVKMHASPQFSNWWSDSLSYKHKAFITDVCCQVFTGTESGYVKSHQVLGFENTSILQTSKLSHKEEKIVGEAWNINDHSDT